jgi:hypothetical protein
MIGLNIRKERLLLKSIFLNSVSIGFLISDL